jgi:hypothetical protein
MKHMAVEIPEDLGEVQVGIAEIRWEHPPENFAE